MSPSAPITQNTTKMPVVKSVKRSRKGNAATATAETTSVKIEMLRRLVLSMTTPISRPARRAGTAVAAESSDLL